MTIADWLARATEALRASGCPDPEIDARWIAEDVLRMTAPELRFEAQSEPEPRQLEQLNAALDRRKGGEPVQYILLRADFMGLRLYIDERALIPRQDTETLAEAAIVALQGRRSARVLDLCAGSGAIGLSIATLVPGAKLTLADLSAGALEVARRNARELNVDAELRKGDLFQAIGVERFDLIACNPPYIPTAELPTLQREVRREPEMALDGGPDGLRFYRRIAAEAGAHLNPGGSIYLEVGAGQAQDVLALMKGGLNFADAGIVRDLNGIERVVWIKIH